MELSFDLLWKQKRKEKYFSRNSVNDLHLEARGKSNKRKKLPEKYEETFQYFV